MSRRNEFSVLSKIMARWVGLKPASPVANELQHFGGEQPNRAGRQAVRPIIVLLILPDRLIIGAKDKRRAVDEKNMVAGADRAMGLGHGHHISDAASKRHRGPPERRYSLAPFIEQSLFRLQFRFPGCAESPLSRRRRWKRAGHGFSQRLGRRRCGGDCDRRRLRTAQRAVVHHSERVRRRLRLRLCLQQRPRARPDGGRLHRACRLSARSRAADSPAARQPVDAGAASIRTTSTPALASACSVPPSPGSRRGSIRPTS